MLVNAFEFTMMNNPLWWHLQRWLIARRWVTQKALVPPGGRILEIGCGSGRGALALREIFSPTEIRAIDLDKRMIERAKQLEDGVVHFEVGDAARMRFGDGIFDAVFDSGVMHHIPVWRNCLHECHRVLKSGGALFLMDFSIETFEQALGKVIKRFTVHPYQEMYREQELVKSLQQLGFEIAHYSNHQAHLLKNFTLIMRKR